MYPELRYLEKKILCKNFFGKCFFSEKLDLRLKKKTKKNWAISILLLKIFIVAIKKILVIQFSYMEIA